MTTAVAPLSLRNPDTWRAELGLLPMPLYPRRHVQAYALLNGARGNFCLDLRDLDEREGRSEVWSADLAYRVAVNGDRVLVQRWDDRSRRPEDFSALEVLERFERFHRYLERYTPPASLSVVAHALSVFRSLRTALGENFSGEEGLRAFLVLLASASQEAPIGELNLRKWGLDPEALDLAGQVRAGEWEGLVNLLRSGRRIDGLDLRLPLVLRHASGRLFQEAHYSAILTPYRQLLFDGLAPDPAHVIPVTGAVGLHFTPSPLARALVEEVIAALPKPLPRELHVFDPACGSGEFLREFIRQLALTEYRGTLRVTGWDISRAAAAMTRFTIAWERQSVDFQIEADVRAVDALSTATEWPQQVTALLMNPPFRSWRDMDVPTKARVLEILGETLKGPRPDLAFAFIKLAANSLTENGALGAILPASFLDGSSGASLRGEISEILSALLLARLGSQDIFHEARVDPALYVGTRSRAASPPMAFWSDHRPTSTSAALRALRRARAVGTPDPMVTSQEGFSIYRNPGIGRGPGSWAPRPFEEWRLLTELGRQQRVSDVFDVRQGVITGLNKVFLISKEQVDKLPASERRFFRPAVLNESFVAGRVIDVGYVFYPYGETSIATEVELSHLVPKFRERHLDPNKDRLLARKRIDEDSWWRLSEHRAWQVQPRPKIVTAYFGDAGSFAWDETGTYVIIQGYAWLAKRIVFPRPVWLAYLALVNSGLMSTLLVASSNNVGGGQFNLSKRFVANMPMARLYPNRSVPRSLVTDLAQIGEAIHLGTFSWANLGAQQELRELSQIAFGVQTRDIG